jgi:hypothetical protein
MDWGQESQSQELGLIICYNIFRRMKKVHHFKGLNNSQEYIPKRQAYKLVNYQNYCQSLETTFWVELIVLKLPSDSLNIPFLLNPPTLSYFQFLFFPISAQQALPT